MPLISLNRRVWSLNRRVWPRSGTRISESCSIGVVPQNFSNASWLVLPTHPLQEIKRWFPQRSLSDTPRSVRAWRTLHAIERIRRYGGEWPKDGCGVLNWLKSKIRSGKVAASESWIGSPHSLGLTNIRSRRGRLRGVRGPWRAAQMSPQSRRHSKSRWTKRGALAGADRAGGFCSGATAVNQILTHVLTERPGGNCWSADKTTGARRSGSCSPR